MKRKFNQQGRSRMKGKCVIVLLRVICAAALSACGGAAQKGADTVEQGSKVEQSFDAAFLGSVVEALVKAHGERERAGAEIGVRQAASKWRTEDGSKEDFEAFCVENYIKNEDDLKKVFERFEDNYEQINGHLHEIGRFLREPTELDRGPIISIESLFAEFDLNSHVVEDMFKTKIAFVILLNFKHYTLDEKIEQGRDWTRTKWAEARMADIFSSRVPPEIRQEIISAFVAAEDYISNYNIHMHHLLTPRNERLFPEKLKLITHWGLRDEIKAQYANNDGLARQRMVQTVMEKIIEQEIPLSAVDNPFADWVVETNEVKATTAYDFDASAYVKKKTVKIDGAKEPDTRYERLLATFKALKRADPYYPDTPTYIDRKFKISREIPEEEVVGLLTAVLSAPVMADIARLVEKRLGRDLEPFDIWYNGFSARKSRKAEDLDTITRKKYPTRDAFQADLPNILSKLGFDDKTAQYLSGKIIVDPSRGAGHAMGAERREDSAHLRTRIGANGMDYKGYNIAIHELGHCVEQVFSLNKMDRYLLHGVPNTAFTEGFAFTFQARDLALLGLDADDADKEHLRALDTIWSTYEICGVAMVDIGIWHWMYEHPSATPKETKDAIIRIARDVWNDYFAPVFNKPDEILLAVYSHIIEIGMYIPDYPIGLLIQFQMEDYFKKHGLAVEMERMCRLGAVTPNAWMQAAVGGPISAEPMIEAAKKAVEALKGR
jgi:hypothetical protein